MAYIPEVDSTRIEDGSIVYADLAPSLQALLVALPVGAGIDFEGFTLPSGWLWEDGAAVSRTTYANLLNAITSVQTGTLNGTINITGLTSTKGIPVGCPVEGTNIPAGATVASIVSATAITISTPATGSGASSLRFFPHGNGNGSTTFNTPDARGRTSVGMDDLGNNGDGGVLDATQVGLNRKLGVQTHALTAAETPLRTHTHSGTTFDVSLNHTHSGTTAADSPDHTHGINGFIQTNGTLVNTTNTGANTRYTNNTTAGTSGGRNSTHTHTFGTGIESSGHTHNFTTGNPSVAEANGTAHQNMQPSRLVNRIVYAGV